MERIDNVRIVINTEILKIATRIPFCGADDYPTSRIDCTDCLDSPVSQVIPQFGINIEHLIQQFEHYIRVVCKSLFKLHPDIDETALEFRIVHKGKFLLDIAVIAECLMHIEDDIQIVLLAPIHKIDHMGYDFFAIYSRIIMLLDYNLIEAKPDVVHLHLGDISDIPFSYILPEMLQVPNGYVHSPVFRQHIESLVVRQPSADSHTTFEPLKFGAYYRIFSIADMYRQKQYYQQGKFSYV